jgi:hypothetical protein
VTCRASHSGGHSLSTPVLGDQDRIGSGSPSPRRTAGISAATSADRDGVDGLDGPFGGEGSRDVVEYGRATGPQVGPYEGIGRLRAGEFRSEASPPFLATFNSPRHAIQGGLHA